MAVMTPGEWRQSKKIAGNVERLKQEAEQSERYRYDYERTSEEKAKHSGVK
jgi:hypothetical protein